MLFPLTVYIFALKMVTMPYVLVQVMMQYDLPVHTELSAQIMKLTFKNL